MTFAKNIIRDSFQRDILILVIASILVGSMLASAVSLGANTYFSKTLASFVGDYGEFDLIINVREEMKSDSAQQIEKIISDVFPGAVMKEGPTLTGKTSFFITLPAQFQTKQVYEDLGKTFGSIPGGAGVGVMTDPRLTIRGVPEGAKNMLMDRIMQMDGVRFAFRDGSSIGVVLQSLDKSAPVEKQINALLKQYQVIEISFPVGSEPPNPIRLGEAIAGSIGQDLGAPYAQNVSVDGKNDDMTYAVSTMMEMRRFLTAYASQVVLTPLGGAKLTKGDTLVFQGTAPAAPAAGSPPDKNNVLVQITGIKGDGAAEGTVVQGDASGLANPQGYKLEKNVVGAAAVTASYKNPRQELSSALTETSKLVGQIPGFAQDARSMSGIAMNALDSYNSGVAAVEKTLNGVQSAGATIEAATSGLANIDTSSLRAQLDTSAKGLGGLINTLKVLKLVQANTDSDIASLAGTQSGLNSLSSTLGALDNVAANARQAKTAIDSVVSGGQSTLDTLKAFDAAGAKTSLADMTGRLDKVQQINVPLVTAQLQYMAASAPNLKDEDISHTLAIIDKFIAGQVIPGERIQILTTSAVNSDAVAPIVAREAGHSNAALYSTAMGIIEPDARGQLYQVLHEVKAVLAGITAMVATILFLVFDHTAVMAVIRRRRLANRAKPAGWRAVMAKFTAITAAERLYGMACGGVMLTAMFIIAGGGFPYLPWIGVPLLGAALGLLVAGYAEKISPVAADEIMAGEALGLSFDEVMREIVIPAARPGLLQKLNNRKVKFR
jgi:hypothetical protein